MPSSSALTLIRSEKSGVWAESYNDGNCVALLVKAPSLSIKAILQGCDVQLIFGINTPGNIYLISSLLVYDSKGIPILLTTIPRSYQEIQDIRHLIKQEKFIFTIFDEIDSPVCHGEGFIDSQIGNSFKKYCDLLPFTPVQDSVIANEVTDSFCYSLDPAYGTTRHHESQIERFQLKLFKIESQPCYSGSEYGGIFYQIDVDEEGSMQEKQLSHFLAYSFGANVFYSPQVKIGKKIRELIDVLAFDEKSNYLIESKAFCINKSNYDIPLERKLARLIGQANNALDQLLGCSKAIRRGESIKSSTGEIIELENKHRIHGIAVISEFHPSDQWNVIINKIIELSHSNGIYLHVIDLSEFINIIKLSESPTISFEQCLVERFNAMIEHNTLNIKGFDSGRPILI